MEMGTWKKLIFLLLFTVSSTISQPDFFGQSCSDNRNYTTNSPFRENLDNILSSVSSNTQFIDTGFYNSSSGLEPDRVNLIALCRADLSVQDCRNCFNNSRIKILDICPNQKEAIGRYDECMIRYSNSSIFGVLSSSVFWFTFNPRNSSDINGFTQVLRNLTDTLRTEAASGNSLRKFAMGQIRLPSPSFNTIYELVQCTPDLSSMDCNNCIGQLASFIPAGRLGGSVLTTSCYLRYETFLFYNLQASTSPPPPPVDGDDSRSQIMATWLEPS